MKTNGDVQKTLQPERYKYYKTFGHVTAPQVRRYPIWWWAVALGVLAVLYGFGTLAVLLVNSARAEFQLTQMPRYDQGLTFALSGTRFQVGDSAQLSIALANPVAQRLPIQNVTVQVPPKFLDAFTVDAAACAVERRTDGSGTIRCPDTFVTASGTRSLAIPMHASQAGNYAGDIKLALDLTVPLAQPPWYMYVDAHGNYKLALRRQLRPEFRIVPKP